MSETKTIEGVKNGIRISKEDRDLLKQFMEEDVPLIITWKSLMPVVDKITSLLVNDSILIYSGNSTVLVTIVDRDVHKSNNLIDSMYSAVIDFIKWYNIQTKLERHRD